MHEIVEKFGDIMVLIAKEYASAANNLEYQHALACLLSSLHHDLVDASEIRDRYSNKRVQKTLKEM